MSQPFEHNPFFVQAMLPATGIQDPEDGAEHLMVRTDSLEWNNEMLLRDTLVRAGDNPEYKKAWLFLLLEFCISFNHSSAERIALAQSIFSQKLCDPMEASRSCSLGSFVHLAAETGSLAALDFALQIDPHGAYVTNGIFSQTPFHCAAIRDDEDAVRVIQRLQALNINPNTKDKDGLTPLFRSLNPQTTQALLEAGADPMIYGPHQVSPLATHLHYGSTESAKLLLQAGATANNFQSTNPSHFYKTTPLQLRTAFGIYALGLDRQQGHPFALELFLLGADPFALDPQGLCAFTALSPQAQARIEHHVLTAQLSLKEFEARKESKSL